MFNLLRTWGRNKFDFRLVLLKVEPASASTGTTRATMYAMPQSDGSSATLVLKFIVAKYLKLHLKLPGNDLSFSILVQKSSSERETISPQEPDTVRKSQEVAFSNGDRPPALR